MHSIDQKFDFHCHSTASDGSQTPEQLLLNAEESGLEYLSLTDHDTLEGVKRLAPSIQLEVIPGVEISCVWRGITLHILAYGFSLDDPSMSEFIALQTERRIRRGEIIARRLEKRLKTDDILTGVRALSGLDAPGRPHFAQFLVQQNMAVNFKDAFKRYLGAGKIGDVKTCWPEMHDVLEVLKRSNALAVVAHPFYYKLTATKLRTLLTDFKECGGHGVEVAVPQLNSGQYGWITDQVRKMDLLVSGGSDFHGTGSPWSKLGRFPKLPTGMPTILDALNLNNI